MAARRAFPALEQTAATRFPSPALREVLTQEPGVADENTYLGAVATSRGVRRHAVEVRQSYDPPDGARNFLITEVDVIVQETAKRVMAVLVTQDRLALAAQPDLSSHCGGTAVRAFQPELAERSHRFLQIDTELREALIHKRLKLF